MDNLFNSKIPKSDNGNIIGSKSNSFFNRLSSTSSEPKTGTGLFGSLSSDVYMKADDVSLIFSGGNLQIDYKGTEKGLDELFKFLRENKLTEKLFEQ